jgi:hypothetical protein
MAAGNFVLFGIPIILVILGIGYTISDGFDLGDYFAGIFFSIIGGVLSFFVIALIILGLMYLPSHHYEYAYSKEILSLNDTQQFHGQYSGNFLFASGSVNKDLYYYYAEKDKNGYISIAKKKMNKVKIKEVDGKPQLLVYHDVFTGRFARWFFGKETVRDNTYKMNVPEHTLKIQWKVDMK